MYVWWPVARLSGRGALGTHGLVHVRGTGINSWKSRMRVWPIVDEIPMLLWYNVENCGIIYYKGAMQTVPTFEDKQSCMLAPSLGILSFEADR